MDAKYRAYLKSDQWRAVRNRIFSIRGRKCEVCAAVIRLQIHHLTYDNIYREKDEDLIVLCNICHSKVHHKKPVVKRRKRKIKLSKKAAYKKQLSKLKKWERKIGLTK